MQAHPTGRQQGFILLIVFLILLLIAGAAASFMFVKNRQGKTDTKSTLTSLLQR